MLDLWPGAFPQQHTDRIESVVLPPSPVAVLPDARNALHLPPFERCDRLERMTKCASGTRLYFHEHHQVFLAGDQVDLAMPEAIVAGQDLVSSRLQMSSR